MDAARGTSMRHRSIKRAQPYTWPGHRLAHPSRSYKAVTIALGPSTSPTLSALAGSRVRRHLRHRQSTARSTCTAPRPTPRPSFTIRVVALRRCAGRMSTSANTGASVGDLDIPSRNDVEPSTPMAVLDRTAVPVAIASRHLGRLPRPPARARPRPSHGAGREGAVVRLPPPGSPGVRRGTARPADGLRPTTTSSKSVTDLSHGGRISIDKPRDAVHVRPVVELPDEHGSLRGTGRRSHDDVNARPESMALAPPRRHPVSRRVDHAPVSLGRPRRRGPSAPHGDLLASASAAPPPLVGPVPAIRPPSRAGGRREPGVDHELDVVGVEDPGPGPSPGGAPPSRVLAEHRVDPATPARAATSVASAPAERDDVTVHRAAAGRSERGACHPSSGR